MPGAPVPLRSPYGAVPGALPTVPRTAPAMHRSVRRTAVILSLATGASVAAVWGVSSVARMPVQAPPGSPGMLNLVPHVEPDLVTPTPTTRTTSTKAATVKFSLTPKQSGS